MRKTILNPRTSATMGSPSNVKGSRARSCPGSKASATPPLENSRTCLIVSSSRLPTLLDNPAAFQGAAEDSSRPVTPASTGSCNFGKPVIRRARTSGVLKTYQPFSLEGTGGGWVPSQEPRSTIDSTSSVLRRPGSAPLSPGCKPASPSGRGEAPRPMSASEIRRRRNMDVETRDPWSAAPDNGDDPIFFWIASTAYTPGKPQEFPETTSPEKGKQKKKTSGQDGGKHHFRCGSKQALAGVLQKAESLRSQTKRGTVDKSYSDPV